MSRIDSRKKHTIHLPWGNLIYMICSEWKWPMHRSLPSWFSLLMNELAEERSPLISGWRITSRRITHSGWIRLIKAWHLLHGWNCHRLWSKLAISLVHFNLVLCLHACTYRAIDPISYARQYLRSLGNFLTSNNHSNNWEYASKLLKAEHETNDAIITLCCLNVELILQQKSSRSHRISKAQEYLCCKTEFRAFTFSTPSTARHIASTANIPWHIIVKSSLPKHIRYTWCTPKWEAAISRISLNSSHEIGVPEIPIILSELHLFEILLSRHLFKCSKMQ